MTAERQALTEAHAAVAKARADLEGSRSASASARAFLEEVSRAAEALREVDRDSSAARARELKEALKSRSTPRFQSAPQVLENAAARADAESQVTAAAQAAAELADEEAQAEKALEAAQDNLAAAVKAVLCSEARALASRIDAKASELVALRAQLGGVHSFVGQQGSLGRRWAQRSRAFFKKMIGRKSGRATRRHGTWRSEPKMLGLCSLRPWQATRQRR
jgi:chromosome segregation ATPase